MKAMVGLVFAILIIFCLRLFWPSSGFEMKDVSQSEVSNDNTGEQVETSEVVTNETDLSSPELNVPSDEEKTRLMTAEYELLELARKKLKRHLAQLKHDMWGLKFPSNTAKEMSKSVMSASKLLKNPHMLGAFSSVEQIKDEVAKVNFAEKSLEEVDEIIKAKIEEDTGNTDQTNSAMQ